MHTSLKRPGRYLLALALLSTLPLGGCVALLGAGAGGGAVAYVENGGVANYYAYYPVSLSTASRGTQAAFQQMNIRYNGMIQKSANEAIVEGTTNRGQTARVTLTSMATDVTKVNIRIGTFGDRAESLQFQHLLSQQLGAAASAVAPSGTVPSPSTNTENANQSEGQQTIPLQ
ncbi:MULTISPECIES: DUF3568 family protein [Acidithiobacillus]|jgi:hypothetical protein|uniref:Lipoprotein n=2 Tax=Acidithiobacillus caldus TaxID=33059 RepID=F9ZMN1_ACICS|nr:MULTISPECIES: DUF3568 family protein [Acidithiobacillus]AEK57335.1 conserved hypothetical protein [Acidithiobacillus caldus SM-1]AIA54594.1 hypothetical protein Acaty_c0716 [Acidithiobacillus caldus ATCC 51756]AUW32083.1 DUF3568 family protein [Acidithiobacillus caldus]MBU2728682.1 DUF3568 family protein [Acidithiobacillus caldus]MBU2735835.1 DUF3568 family protein [Acidithiobacillus caldus ATCC 51756]